MIDKGRVFVFLAMLVTIAIAASALVYAWTETQSASARNRASQVTSCQALNAAQIKTGELLNQIMKLPGLADPQYQTRHAAVRQATDIGFIKAEITKNYAPANCAALFATR